MQEKGFVAEYGHGARPANVEHRYDSTDPLKPGARVVVSFDDPDLCHRDCYATSFHATREAANEAAKP